MIKRMLMVMLEAEIYRPEAVALEQTIARSEGGWDNEVMLISVQTFNFVI